MEINKHNTHILLGFDYSAPTTIVEACKLLVERDAIVYVMAEWYESMRALPWATYFWGIHDGYKANGLSVVPLLTAVKRTRNEVVEGLRKAR